MPWQTPYDQREKGPDVYYGTSPLDLEQLQEVLGTRPHVVTGQSSAWKFADNVHPYKRWGEIKGSAVIVGDDLEQIFRLAGIQDASKRTR